MASRGLVTPRATPGGSPRSKLREAIRAGRPVVPQLPVAAVYLGTGQPVPPAASRSGVCVAQRRPDAIVLELLGELSMIVLIVARPDDPPQVTVCLQQGIDGVGEGSSSRVNHLLRAAGEPGAEVAAGREGRPDLDLWPRLDTQLDDRGPAQINAGGLAPACMVPRLSLLPCARSYGVGQPEPRGTSGLRTLRSASSRNGTPPSRSSSSVGMIHPPSAFSFQA